VIKLYTFHPEHFNNNGDQGNVEVLAAELTAALVEFEFVESVAEADFVLIGDASRAAMRHYTGELEALRPAMRERFQFGRPTLVVGSSYEFLASEFGLISSQVHRRSEFFDGDYFGYRNTDKDLPAVTRNGEFIATSLYGPFLAKNPRSLTEILASLGVQVELSAERLTWIKRIREVSAG
jgi:CobQ-like glutamine amidotransferase family enzyme